jgi:hypothetical protein
VRSDRSRVVPLQGQVAMPGVKELHASPTTVAPPSQYPSVRVFTLPPNKRYK